jgi:hypothetical protein
MFKFPKNWVLVTASSVQNGAYIGVYVLHTAQKAKGVIVIIMLILHIIIRNKI